LFYVEVDCTLHPNNASDRKLRPRQRRKHFGKRLRGDKNRRSTGAQGLGDFGGGQPIVDGEDYGARHGSRKK
jgi:hypothetical protein